MGLVLIIPRLPSTQTPGTPPIGTPLTQPPGPARSRSLRRNQRPLLSQGQRGDLLARATAWFVPGLSILSCWKGLYCVRVNECHGLLGSRDRGDSVTEDTTDPNRPRQVGNCNSAEHNADGDPSSQSPRFHHAFDGRVRLHGARFEAGFAIVHQGCSLGSVPSPSRGLQRNSSLRADPWQLSGARPVCHCTSNQDCHHD